MQYIITYVISTTEMNLILQMICFTELNTKNRQKHCLREEYLIIHEHN